MKTIYTTLNQIYFYDYICKYEHSYLTIEIWGDDGLGVGYFPSKCLYFRKKYQAKKYLKKFIKRRIEPNMKVRYQSS